MAKRDKRSRLRGHRGGGWGSRKKHRSSGNRGGFGMAGTGKKAGQKRTLVLKTMPGYFGKHGFHSITKEEKKSIKVINLERIALRLDDFKKEGIAKTTPEGLALNLEGYKILAEGEVSQKLIISATSFSERAKEKIAAKGGKALLVEN